MLTCESGAASPSYGGRYLNELLNVVPRVIWPSKPLIGIDYAKWRGLEEPESELGVSATVSTGMIGGGVLNFGRFFGPSGSRHHHGALDWSAHPLVATTKIAFAPGVVHAGRRSYIQPRSRHQLCWCSGLSYLRTVLFVSLKSGRQNSLALRRKSQRKRRLSVLLIFNRQAHHLVGFVSNSLFRRRERNWR